MERKKMHLHQMFKLGLTQICEYSTNNKIYIISITWTSESCLYKELPVSSLRDITEGNERLTLARNNISLRRYEDHYLEKL